MRQFGKFKIEGDKIIHSNGTTIPEDEPIWLFRGRDELAVATLKFYFELCELNSCTDYQLLGIKTAIDKFEKFKIDHTDRMKQPGITKGA